MKQKKYRVKAVLADGRTVYWSKRGMISTVEGRGMVAVKRGGHHGFYTSDLSMFSTSPDLIPTRWRVAVTRLDFEDSGKPVDTSAFIMGGLKATEVMK